MKPKKIIYLPKDMLGYFGWPSICRRPGGLTIVASGFRQFHTCPFGRLIRMDSPNEGKDWSSPIVVLDSLKTDFRDPGVVWWNDGFVYTGFSSDVHSRAHEFVYLKGKAREMYFRGMIYHDPKYGHPFYTKDDAHRKTWLSAPHGPIETYERELIYMGRCEEGIAVAKWAEPGIMSKTTSTDSDIVAGWRDAHDHWRKLAVVPLPDGANLSNIQEPHIIQTGEHSFMGIIRYQTQTSSLGYENEFSMYQTNSKNDGKSWSKPKRLFDGSPPHLMRHERGTIILTYGQRIRPYGIRAAVSDDNGETWRNDITLWDGGIDVDLGYPASIETKDGAILTVYYGKLKENDKCGILSTKWKLPA